MIYDTLSIRWSTLTPDPPIIYNNVVTDRYGIRIHNVITGGLMLQYIHLQQSKVTTTKLAYFGKHRVLIDCSILNSTSALPDDLLMLLKPPIE